MTLILILLATLYALGVFAAAAKGWIDWDFANNRKESRQAARTFLLSLVWPLLAIEAVTRRTQEMRAELEQGNNQGNGQ